MSEFQIPAVFQKEASRRLQIVSEVSLYCVETLLTVKYAFEPNAYKKVGDGSSTAENFGFANLH